MDPRVERTRLHVLEVTRALLAAEGAEAVTFSSVSQAARVARQTLYRHWSTREQLIAEMLSTNRGYDHPLQIQETPADYLRAFLLNVRDLGNAPAVASATAQLMTHATTNPESAAALKVMRDDRMDSLRAGWGPLSEDDYAIIVGPALFQVLVMRKPMTDEFISTLVDEAVARRSDRESDIGVKQQDNPAA